MLFVVKKKKHFRVLVGGGGGTPGEPRGYICPLCKRGQFYEIVSTVSGTAHACKCGRGFELRITEKKLNLAGHGQRTDPETDPGLQDCESDALSTRPLR